MGILNLTPDSFFDGGKYTQKEHYLAQTEKMLTEGADFIDIGAASTDSGAIMHSAQEEIGRMLPALDAIKKEFPQAIISIDTYQSQVAQAALDCGVDIINDISAGFLDDQMMSVVAKYKVPYIMMHMRGNPQTMAGLTQYEDVVKEMMLYFSERIQKARSLGINDLVIDPGFGFAKTVEQNFEILQKLELFNLLELPILAGLSRKSMIYKTLKVTPEESLTGTIALNMTALHKGAKILRVHDVKAAVETVQLFCQMEL
ncbi:MAG: dihydropteroate synthase [Bacteroidetes bacterium]|nr:dihydropteroate synthase [Bacteroidota bacterium]